MIVYKQRRSLLEAGLEQTDQATASSLNIALEGALGSMAFQFVNTTADKRKPDDKTRKKIRSQVMKDYRRRREEGEAGPSAGRVTRSPSTSGRASPQIDTRTARSQVGRLSRASSTGEHATPPPEVLGERSTKRGRPGKIQQQQAASLFLQTAHGLFSNFTVDLSAKTSPQEDRSPSRDESELNRMLEICERYNEWLIPGRGVTNPMAPDINDNSQAAKMQLYALTLMSIGHLSAVGVYDGEDERAYYKARLLGIAHRLLQDPERALQDATVGALACLTSYEVGEPFHEKKVTNDTDLIRLLRSLDSPQRHISYHRVERWTRVCRRWTRTANSIRSVSLILRMEGCLLNMIPALTCYMQSTITLSQSSP